MKIVVNILFTIGFLFAQQIDWNNKPSPITAIEIYCDTEGIPIYVDGIKIGISPITQAVQVAPGWHQVSYFPPGLKISESASAEDRLINDLIRLAKQDILVEEGKTVRVVLSYSTIESEVIEYERRINSNKPLRAAMILLILFTIGWGVA